MTTIETGVDATYTTWHNGDGAGIAFPNGAMVTRRDMPDLYGTGGFMVRSTNLLEVIRGQAFDPVAPVEHTGGSGSDARGGYIAQHYESDFGSRVRGRLTPAGQAMLAAGRAVMAAGGLKVRRHNADAHAAWCAAWQALIDLGACTAEETPPSARMTFAEMRQAHEHRQRVWREVHEGKAASERLYRSDGERIPDAERAAAYARYRAAVEALGTITIE